jgi:hypothetical protein
VIYGLPLGFPHYVPLRDSRSLRNGVVEPSYGSFQVVRSELQGSLSGRALQLSIPKALGHCSVEREHFRKPSRRRHLHGYVSTAWHGSCCSLAQCFLLFSKSSSEVCTCCDWVLNLDIGQLNCRRAVRVRGETFSALWFHHEEQQTVTRP